MQLTLFCYTGPIAVKAFVLTVVERLHANGWGMLYDALPGDVTQVSANESQQSMRVLEHSAGLEDHRCIQNLPES